MPLPGVRAGTYEKTGETLRLRFGEKTSTLRASVEKDRLRVVDADGDTHEYRYGGERPWYEFSVTR